ncbi:MAG: hypothetical protein ACPGLY_18145 [Rubripirellula sp.]
MRCVIPAGTLQSNHGDLIVNLQDASFIKETRELSGCIIEITEFHEFRASKTIIQNLLNQKNRELEVDLRNNLPD